MLDALSCASVNINKNIGLCFPFSANAKKNNAVLFCFADIFFAWETASLKPGFFFFFSFKAAK